MAPRINGLLLLLVLSVIGYVSAFIVPQEVPSLLSLVYSNIPPIKKGTDSRVGFGYRLGEHADFQVMLELGPQLYTKPLRGGSTSGSDTSKRNVNQDDYTAPVKSQKSPNPVGSQYLNNWAQDLKQNPPTAANAPVAPMRVQTQPYIEESALRQLQQLYKLQPQVSTPAEVGTQSDTIGTLPAASMDAVVAHLNKVRFGNTLQPQTPKSPAQRNSAKITADLMDIGL